MIPLAFLAPAMGFARSWWKAGVGIVIGAALAFPAGCMHGGSVERARQAERVKAAAELQQVKNEAAADTATVERQRDTAAVTSQQKARTDAIDTAPAGRAPPSSVSLACCRLQQQGTRPEALPANCRPVRACEAAPHR